MRSFRGDVVQTLGAQSFGVLLNFALVILSSRWLGAEGRGVYALLLVSGQIGSTIASFGFPGAVPFFIGKDVSTARSLVRNTLMVTVAVSAVLYGSAQLARWFGNLNPVVGSATAVVVFIGAASVTSLFGQLGLSVGRAWVYNFVSVAPIAVGLAGIGILRATRGLTGSSAFWAQSVGQVIAGLTGAWALSAWTRGRNLPVVGWFEHFRVARLGVASAFLGVVLFRADIYLVTVLGGSLAAAGIYSVAVQIAELIVKVPMWIATVLSPRAARDPVGTVGLTIRLAMWSAAYAIALFVPILLFGDSVGRVVQGVLGRDFGEVRPLLSVFALRIVAHSTATCFAAYLAGRGYTFYHPLSNLVGVVVTALADVLLIPRLGVMGAAIGSGVGFSAMAVVAFFGFVRVVLVMRSSSQNVQSTRSTSVVPKTLAGDGSRNER